MNLKRSKEEGKKLVKKKTNKTTSPQIPPTLGINLEDYAMENFCHALYANYSEKNLSKVHKFIQGNGNSMGTSRRR
jgi:hypothetical protein